MLLKLNIIAPTYNSGDGLTYNSIGFPLCDSLNDNDFFNLMNKLLTKKYIKLKKYKTITQKNHNKVFDYVEDHEIYYQKQYIDNLAIIKVPFKKVIVKYQENTWYGKLRKWYDKDDNKLPKLNTHKYIKIIEEFMCIEINAYKKKSPIIFEDILFATRGLMLDNSRHVNRYTISKQKNNTLILEPDIDNFST